MFMIQLLSQVSNSEYQKALNTCRHILTIEPNNVIVLSYVETLEAAIKQGILMLFLSCLIIAILQFTAYVYAENEESETVTDDDDESAASRENSEGSSERSSVEDDENTDHKVLLK